MLLSGFSKYLRPRSLFKVISEQVLLYPSNKEINISSKFDQRKMRPEWEPEIKEGRGVSWSKRGSKSEPTLPT